MSPKYLVIQSAFIGDVVLATCLIEKLHQHQPDARIDFLLRKGNESLLVGNPNVHEVLIWDKQNNKIRNLWKLFKLIRSRKYDKVINVQRFAATGFLTAFSGAKEKIGFDKNPFRFFFNRRIKHIVSKGKNVKHEIERNSELVSHFAGDQVSKPRLYPSAADFEYIKQYSKVPYITLSPASVWVTKQFPAEKWSNFIKLIPGHIKIYLLGAASDTAFAESIRVVAGKDSVMNLCGQLTFLQSAALMKGAMMNYTNDSAPLHFASAMNAPVTAIYCSTLPSFGFGPLSDKSFIVEVNEKLACRPCGIHGKKACPLQHFNCAMKIKEEQLLATLPTPA